MSAIFWRTPRKVALLRDPFDKYFRAAAAMTIGLALGFLMTSASLRAGYGFGEISVGPWKAWPNLGGDEIDPYARASVARRGIAPLGRSEGLVFVAQSDSFGAPLEGRCDYRIFGTPPAARFWTIGLASASGAPLGNAAERYGFASSEVVRRENGDFEITVAREARPWNWLSPGDARSFVVTLRLYDSALDAAAMRLDPAHFLQIVKLSCA
ncbi:MAG TPA: DUF1214 domain-containing protein [Methylocystis sp.]|nr:DUF1214 domain-containing protein [Methylocystis sp.]